MKSIIKTVSLGLFFITCLPTQQLKASESEKLPLHTAVLNLDDKKVYSLLEEKKCLTPTAIDEYTNTQDAAGENAFWHAIMKVESNNDNQLSARINIIHALMACNATPSSENPTVHSLKLQWEKIKNNPFHELFYDDKYEQEQDLQALDSIKKSYKNNQDIINCYRIMHESKLSKFKQEK